MEDNKLDMHEHKACSCHCGCGNHKERNHTSNEELSAIKHNHEHKHEHDDCCSHEHKHEHDDCCSHEHKHNECAVTIDCGCGCSHDKKPKTKVKGSRIKRFFIDNVYNFIKIAASLLIVIVMYAFEFNITVNYILGIAAILPIGIPMLIDAIKAFKRKIFINEKTLMLIASVGAVIIGEFFEGALVLALFLLGEMIEDVAVEYTQDSVASLAEIKNETANLIVDGKTVSVSAYDVPVGSKIMVLAGERIPIDGVLNSDFASIDTRSVSGESKPREVSFGGEIFSGSVNIGSPIEMLTTKKAEDSMAEKISELVLSASSKKSESQKFISKFAKYYTPVVVFIALIIGGVVPLFTGYDFAKWIYTALSFLVISCPCALVISVPLTFFIGIGNLARQGVLVRGGLYLERLAGVSTAVFDKTGTLTKGEFTVDNIYAEKDFDDKFVLDYLSAVESLSSHPLAKAVTKHHSSKFTAINVKEIAGKGLTAEVNGKTVLAGNKKLLSDYGIFTEKDFGDTCIYLAVDDKFAGALILKDELKPNVKRVLSDLKKTGVDKFVMLTGDNKKVAEDVALSLGIDTVKSGLLPDEKVTELEKIISTKNRGVMYIGDGINDAPCIKLADIGVAMGGQGSASAVACSDMVIMDDDITKIVKAKRLASRTRRLVTENIVFSILIKLSVMVISAILPVPVYLAVFADVGVMLLAVLNGLRNNLKLK